MSRIKHPKIPLSLHRYSISSQIVDFYHSFFLRETIQTVAPGYASYSVPKGAERAGSPGNFFQETKKTEVVSDSESTCFAMNNLVLLQAAPTALSALLTSDISIIDVDPTIPGIFGVSSEGRLVGVKSVDQGGIIVDADVPDSGPFICLHSLPELEAIFLASSSGKLLLLQIESGEWETVGELDGGLLCASWSSDDEVLMCVTKNNALVVLNVMWDVLAEKQLEGSLPSHAFVSWTGDGLKAGLQTIDAESGKGRVMVLDRDLKVPWPTLPRCSTASPHAHFTFSQVESTSEDENGLGEPVAFIPDGGLLASTRRSEGKHEVIFFEPNGLRHYEFSLRNDCMESTVKDIGWNIDGTCKSSSLHASRKKSVFYRKNRNIDDFLIFLSAVRAYGGNSS